MIQSLKNTLHLLRIGWTLARQDALFIFRDMGLPMLPLLLAPVTKHSNAPKGERLRRALETLGPTYIKLGQMLSTRADLVGEDIAEELGNLRDKLPAFSSITAKRIIKEELGKPVDELFVDFDDTAVAAASIAQVHKARLHDGTFVAVKILRPEVHEAFKRDLELFYWIAQTIEIRLPEYRRLKPVEVVETFRHMVAFELDLRYEAAAATELAENTKDDSGFRVPAIEWNYTSERVLVLDWVDGTNISDTESLKAQGFDLDTLLTSASESFFKHVFRDGFFHADLHPGNIFVDREGCLVAVDFGIMGRLDARSRIFMAEILGGFLNEDYDLVARAHFRAGYVPASQSVEEFKLACMAIAKPILNKPLHEISVAKLLGQLFQVTETFQMETQPQLLLLQKSLVMVEGVGRMLNPNINMWEMAREPIASWAKENLSPPGRAKFAAKEVKQFVEHLPQKLGQLEASLEILSDPAGIKLHPDSLHSIRTARQKGRREWLIFAWTSLIAVLALSAYWMT